jgi:hypothetical protein
MPKITWNVTSSPVSATLTSVLIDRVDAIELILHEVHRLRRPAGVFFFSSHSLLAFPFALGLPPFRKGRPVASCSHSAGCCRPRQHLTIGRGGPWSSGIRLGTPGFTIYVGHVCVPRR